MKKQSDASREYHEINKWIPRIYTDDELLKFDKLIREKFGEPKKLQNGNTLNVPNIDKFLKYVRAISPNGSIYVEVLQQGYGDTPTQYKEPTRYKYYWNLLNQWSSWNARTKYGRQEQLKAYESLSQEVKELTDNEIRQKDWGAMADSITEFPF
jgi:hypothetical protein